MAEETSNFKWNNRKKATETAVQLKIEEEMTAEQAVRKVLKDYEGTYHINGNEISEKRFNNFVNRVEKEKKYKAPKTTPKKVELTQSKIKVLLDKGEVTELQAIVLDTVFHQLASYQFGASDIILADIAEEAGMRPERVKGALGHLIKKGFLKSVETKIDGKEFSVIHIEEDKQDLYNDDLIKYKQEMADQGEPDDDEVSDDEIKAVIGELNTNGEPAI